MKFNGGFYLFMFVVTEKVRHAEKGESRVSHGGERSHARKEVDDWQISVTV